MTGQKTLDKWPGPPGIHAIAHQLGIPAETLASLRAGTHVAVPSEPTEAMLDAGKIPGWSRLETRGRYRAMLAAAPGAQP